MKIKYCFLHGLYWMLFCVNGGYVTAYLVGIGVKASTVGVVTAVFCALSAVMQPMLGKAADKGHRFHWINQLKVMVLIMIVCNALMLIQKEKIFSAVLCGLITLCLNCAMPFVNGASFYYENRGVKMNFGVARGIGSLSYAVISMVLGRLMNLMGVNAVCITGLINGLLLFGMVCLFHEIKLPDVGTPQGEKDEKDDRRPDRDAKVGEILQTDRSGASLSQGEFIRKYPYFMMMLVGFTCLLAAHNITNTYLLQMVEHVGGSSAEMGTTLSIAATLEIPIMFSVSYLVKRWRVDRLLLASGIFFTLKMVIYIFASNVYMIYAAQILQPFSYGIQASVCVYFAQEAMDEDNKLRGQSFVTSSNTLGAVLGNLVGGIVVQQLGVSAMLRLSAGICFAGALIIGLFHKKAVAVKATSHF